MYPYILNESIFDDIEIDEVEDKDVDVDETEYVSYEDASGTEYWFKIWVCDWFKENQSYKKKCENTISLIIDDFLFKKQINAFKIDSSKKVLISKSNKRSTFVIYFKVDGEVVPDTFIGMMMMIVKSITHYAKYVELHIQDEAFCLYRTNVKRYRKEKIIEEYEIVLSSSRFFSKIFPSINKDVLFSLLAKYAIKFSMIRCVDEEHGIYVMVIGKTNKGFTDKIFKSSGLMITDVKGLIGYYNEGYAKVAYNTNDEDKNIYNFIDIDGNALSTEIINKNNVPKNFYTCGYFSNGYARVGKYSNGRILYNFINTKGELVYNWWLIKAEKEISDGRFIVGTIEESDKMQLMDTDGNIIDCGNISTIDKFNNGFAIVKKYKEEKKYVEVYNYISTEGEILYPDMWFNSVCSFEEYLGRVSNDERKCNFVTRDGKLLFDNWVDGIVKVLYSDEIYCIRFDSNKIKILDKDGSFITNDEFVNCNSTKVIKDDEDEYLIVGKEYKDDVVKYNLINVKTGQYLFKDWFYEIFDCKNGLFKVCIEYRQQTFVDKNGERVLNNDYKSVESFRNGLFCIKIYDAGYNKGYQIIDSEGKPVIDDIYNFVDEYVFENGYVGLKVSKHNEKGFDVYNVIGPDLKYMLKDWCMNITLWQNVIFVKENAKVTGDRNVINHKGEPAYSVWFNIYDENALKKNDIVVVYADIDTYGTGKIERKYNIIDKNGRMMCGEWLNIIPVIDRDDMIHIGMYLESTKDGEFVAYI